VGGKVMKKFWDKIADLLPILWGIILVLIITFGGLALVITTFSWLLIALGVM
jgi:hypothetical protein